MLPVSPQMPRARTTNPDLPPPSDSHASQPSHLPLPDLQALMLSTTPPTKQQGTPHLPRSVSATTPPPPSHDTPTVPAPSLSSTPMVPPSLSATPSMDASYYVNVGDIRREGTDSPMYRRLDIPSTNYALLYETEQKQHAETKAQLAVVQGEIKFLRNQGRLTLTSSYSDTTTADPEELKVKLAAALERIARFEARQKNFSELEKLQQTWIDNLQPARQLFEKLHEENERVLAILAGLKRNLFGQKKLKGEDAALVEQAAARALDQSTLMKTVLRPLEQEVAVLKRKLTSAAGSTSMASTNDTDSMSESSSLAPEKGELRMERSKRLDLEMELQVLQTQRTVLINETYQLRTSLNAEKVQHNELKFTWQHANEHFLEMQKSSELHIKGLQAEIARLKMSAGLPRTEVPAMPHPGGTSPIASSLTMSAFNFRAAAGVDEAKERFRDFESAISKLRLDHEEEIRMLKQEFEQQHLVMTDEIEAQRIQIVDYEERFASLSEQVRKMEKQQEQGTCILCQHYEQLVKRLQNEASAAEHIAQQAEHAVASAWQEAEGRLSQQARRSEAHLQATIKLKDQQFQAFMAAELLNREQATGQAVSGVEEKLLPQEELMNRILPLVADLKVDLVNAKAAKEQEISRLTHMIEGFKARETEMTKQLAEMRVKLLKVETHTLTDDNSIASTIDSHQQKIALSASTVSELDSSQIRGVARSSMPPLLDLKTLTDRCAKLENSIVLLRSQNQVLNVQLEASQTEVKNLHETCARLKANEDEDDFILVDEVPSTPLSVLSPTTTSDWVSVNYDCPQCSAKALEIVRLETILHGAQEINQLFQKNYSTLQQTMETRLQDVAQANSRHLLDSINRNEQTTKASLDEVLLAHDAKTIDRCVQLSTRVSALEKELKVASNILKVFEDKIKHAIQAAEREAKEKRDILLLLDIDRKNYEKKLDSLREANLLLTNENDQIRKDMDNFLKRGLLKERPLSAASDPSSGDLLSSKDENAEQILNLEEILVKKGQEIAMLRSKNATLEDELALSRLSITNVEGSLVRQFQLRSHMMYSTLLHESEDQKLEVLKNSGKLFLLQRRMKVLSTENERYSAEIRRLKRMIPEKQGAVVSIQDRRIASNRDSIFITPPANRASGIISPPAHRDSVVISPPVDKDIAADPILSSQSSEPSRSLPPVSAPDSDAAAELSSLLSSIEGIAGLDPNEVASLGVEGIAGLDSNEVASFGVEPLGNVLLGDVQACSVHENNPADASDPTNLSS